MPKDEKFKWNETSRHQGLEEVDNVTNTNHKGELQAF